VAACHLQRAFSIYQDPLASASSSEQVLFSAVPLVTLVLRCLATHFPKLQSPNVRSVAGHQQPDHPLRAKAILIPPTKALFADVRYVSVDAKAAAKLLTHNFANCREKDSRMFANIRYAT